MVPDRPPFKCVLDTNVVLDLWHFRDPNTLTLNTLIDQGIAQVMTCELIDAELQHVLTRPQFSVSCTAVLDRWHAVSTQAEITEAAPWRCKDRDDQKFLDLALSTHAETLFTKDKALLTLAKKAHSHALNITKPTNTLVC